ncbi:MAG TPA: hypothetical protein VEI97_19690 [bacterium]|nr:hypothetical protein [bacterium]
MPLPEITQHTLVAPSSEGLLVDTQLLAEIGGKVTEESVASKLEALDWSQFQGQTVLLKGCAPTWVFMTLTHRLVGIAAHLGFKQFDGRVTMVY